MNFDQIEFNNQKRLWLAANPGLSFKDYTALQSSKLRVHRNDNPFGNANCITDQFHKQLPSGPKKYKYKEVRKLEIDSSQKTVKKEVKKPLDPPPSSSSSKIKIEVVLEKFDEGIFVTKIKLGGQTRWKDIKRKFQALDHHPAIKYKKTIETAIRTMKNHKTVQVSLTEGEAMVYKSSQLFEGAKPTSKPKAKSQTQKLNVKCETKYIYNTGPSFSMNNQDDGESFLSASGTVSCSDEDNGTSDNYY